MDLIQARTVMVEYLREQWSYLETAATKLLQVHVEGVPSKLEDALNNSLYMAGMLTQLVHRRLVPDVWSSLPVSAKTLKDRSVTAFEEAVAETAQAISEEITIENELEIVKPLILTWEDARRKLEALFGRLKQQKPEPEYMLVKPITSPK